MKNDRLPCGCYIENEIMWDSKLNVAKCSRCGCVVASIKALAAEPDEPIVKRQTELGDELCEYCQLDDSKKGPKYTPGSKSAGCEGSKCEEAYEVYIEKHNEPTVSKSVGELARGIHGMAMEISDGWECPDPLLDDPEELMRLSETVIANTASLIQQFLDVQIAERDKRIETMCQSCRKVRGIR